MFKNVFLYFILLFFILSGQTSQKKTISALCVKIQLQQTYQAFS